jgi:hypothetical protein
VTYNSLIETLDNRPSRILIDVVTNEVGNNLKKFDTLLQAFFNENDKIAKMAVWAIEKCIEKHPLLLNNNASAFIDKVITSNDDGIQRIGLKVISMITIPTEKLSILLDQCINWLNSDLPVGIRSNCIVIIKQIALIEKELIPEICLIIESHLDKSSTGFNHRAKIALKEIKKRTF